MPTHHSGYEAEVILLKKAIREHIEDVSIANSACAIVDQNQVTFVHKDQDYADGKPLGNFRDSETIGIDPFRGVLLRLNDKKNRIKSFVNSRAYAVQDEKVSDTLRDTANYALIAILLFNELSTDTAPVQQIVIGRLRSMAENAIMSALKHEDGEGSDSWASYFNSFLEDWDVVTEYARGEIVTLANVEGKMVRYGGTNNV